MAASLNPLPLPASVILETPAVLRQVARSHRQLAELKGVVETIPNETILIDTLGLQEAKDSSAIENIVTTEDELFQGDAASAQFPNVATKGKVAGFNPDTSNAGLSYIRDGITVRLQWNHRARYLTTYNAVDSQLVYRIRRDTLDLKTQYQLTRRLSVYLDINNVLREFETGQDRGPRPSQRRVLTPGFFGGINARL